MDSIIFTPNYLKRNNADPKNKNRMQEKPESKKKRTEIKGDNVIKEVGDVEKMLAKAGKRIKGKGKAKKGTDCRTSGRRSRKKNMPAKVQGM